MTNGYRFDVEDMPYLDHAQNESRILALRGTYNEIRLDAKQILQIESQATQGACAGHSLSSILEWCYAIATGGERLQLSRAMGYYEAQRIDGIRGDNGSTISAGVKLATSIGLCTESLWKYPERYNPTRPTNWAEVIENAAKHKIRTEIRITSYDGYRTFLGAGIGGVHGGWNWNDSMNKKVVETFQPTNRDGGHSEAGICLSTRVDSKDRPYIWILGSWGRNFAQSGWQEFSPTCIQQMLQHSNTVLVGLSDMLDIKPRKFSVQEWQNALRI